MAASAVVSQVKLTSATIFWKAKWQTGVLKVSVPFSLLLKQFRLCLHEGHAK